MVFYERKQLQCTAHRASHNIYVEGVDASNWLGFLKLK